MLSVCVIQGADFEVGLIDGLGRVVNTKKLFNGETTFDVSGLPDGIYFVRIGTTANKIIVTK